MDRSGRENTKPLPKRPSSRRADVPLSGRGRPVHVASGVARRQNSAMGRGTGRSAISPEDIYGEEEGRTSPSSGGVPGKKRRRRKKRGKFRLFLKIFFLLLLLAILAALAVFYFKYGNTLLKWQAEAKKMVADSTVDTFKASEASYIYDSKGKVLAKIKGEKDSYYLTFDEIPEYVRDVFVASEDRSFYDHPGYDPKALFGAFITLVKNKMRGEDATRGASTITQQLARNVFTDYLDYLDKSYSRKIREIFVATELEKKYTKDQILEFYVNNAYFANGYYGIEAACRGYFSRSVSKLDLGEIAFVCAIPNRPQTYDPLDHFDNTVSRKDRILDQMLEEEFISAAEYSDAHSEDIVLKPAKEIKTQNYFTTYAITCATKALMQEQGFKFRYAFDSDTERKAYDKEYDEMYDECYKSLHTAGYNIYTTLNKKIQKRLQEAVDQHLAPFTEKKKGTYTMQGAATCIDNKNGRVVAVVGGRQQKSMKGYTLNRAFQGYRQPGSCFKPLAVYTPQLERGYTADTIVDDTYFEGGPRNSGGTYSGRIPLRTAVEYSKNVVAWKLFQELTPEVGLRYVQRMHFSKIVDNDFYPAAALGGLTLGVSTVEMASAYATLANDGKFRNPTCIKKITDYDGNVIVNMKKRIKPREVYKPEAAEAMTDILEGVLVQGTARGNKLSNMACAGKTGTTSDKKDGWFCGYTPYYSTAVWVGCDDPKPISNLYGNTYPLYIWRQFMEGMHSGMKYTAFSYDHMAYVPEPDDDDDPGYERDEPDTPEEIDPDAVDTVHEDMQDNDTPPEEDTPEEDTPEDEPDDQQGMTDPSEEDGGNADNDMNQGGTEDEPQVEPEPPAEDMNDDTEGEIEDSYEDVGEDATIEDVDMGVE